MTTILSKVDLNIHSYQVHQNVWDILRNFFSYELVNFCFVHING